MPQALTHHPVVRSLQLRTTGWCGSVTATASEPNQPLENKHFTLLTLRLAARWPLTRPAVCKTTLIGDGLPHFEDTLPVAANMSPVGAMRLVDGGNMGDVLAKSRDGPVTNVYRANFRRRTTCTTLPNPPINTSGRARLSACQNGRFSRSCRASSGRRRTALLRAVMTPFSSTR